MYVVKCRVFRRVEYVMNKEREEMECGASRDVGVAMTMMGRDPWSPRLGARDICPAQINFNSFATHSANPVACNDEEMNTGQPGSSANHAAAPSVKEGPVSSRTRSKC